MRRQKRIADFVEAIWEWYGFHKRVLPWRDLHGASSTERAYRILVSEVMLQQTQVERVKVIYERFLRVFPELLSLARASNKEVILVWSGMGYNSRALRLRDAARTIVERYDGVFPTELRLLQSIKGLGHYTAAAVRNFAFNLPTPCIDTNIRRILHRTFVGPERADGTFTKDDTYLLKIAGEVLEVALQQQGVTLRDFAARNRLEGCRVNAQRDGSRRFAPHHDTLLTIPRDACNWHAALMDFGSLVQTKKSPKWDQCPLTAQGLMRATARNFPKFQVPSPRSEPGRRIAGHFVPNRIVRGRIVETLRGAPSGLSFDAIGRRVAADWSFTRHRAWLKGILAKLAQERLVTGRGQTYRLAE